MSLSPTEALAPSARLSAARVRQALAAVERAAPWLVVGLAATLRFAALDQAAYTFDDADALRRARAVAAGTPALTGGMTSWGIADPPLLIYVLALTARLPSPVLASYALMALLSTLLVVGTYLVTARFFGRRLGLLAALLCAVNPWVIYFGRRVWVEVQPLLTLLALWAALEVIVGRRARFGGLFFLALAAGAQVRLLGASYAPAALAALVLGGRRWFSRWSTLGIAAGALLSVPFLLHVLQTRNQLADALVEGQRGPSATPRLAAVQFAWWLAAGVNLLPTGPRLADWLDRLGLLLGAASWLVAGLLVAGVVVCALSCARRAPGWPRHALLLAWLLLPLAMLIWQRSTVYLHYLVLLVPTVFLVLALPLTRLLDAGRAGQGLALALLTAIVVVQLLVWGVLQRTLAAYTTDERVETPLGERRLLSVLLQRANVTLGTGEVYGIETPLRFWLAGAERVRAAVPPGAELVVLADGASPEAADLAARLDAVLGPDLVPRYQVPGTVILPLGRPTFLLIAPDVEPPFSLDRVGVQRALVPLPTLARSARDGLRLFELPPRDLAGWVSTLGGQPLRESAEGAPQAVLAPARGRPGETLTVLTFWTGPVVDLRPSVVLLAPSERPLRERAVTLPPPVRLGADELLVRRHQLSLPYQAPPGTYQLVALDGRPGTPPVPLGTLIVPQS